MENKMTSNAQDSGNSQSIKGIALIMFGLTFAIFGWYSIDVTWKDKDPVKNVREYLPGEQQSLKNLAEQLVEQDQKALNEINAQRSDNLWMQEAKSDYPERFVVSPEWFSLVAQDKEIPDFQKKALVEKAEGWPLSTNHAARWIREAYHAIKINTAYEAQQSGVQVLKNSVQ